LFLQGPHGPFFGQLAGQLAAAGHDVRRVGFNAGDRRNWPRELTYQPFRRPVADWPAALAALVRDCGITDIVLYGDGRPVHQAARELGSAGPVLHTFEEGYLRPGWVTYERGGTNGHSRLLDLPLPAAVIGAETHEAPAHWGSIWHHSWHGALYHLHVLLGTAAYPLYQPHRGVSILSEAALHLARLLRLPWAMLRRDMLTRRLLLSGRRYHLALLQLGHDSSVADHSAFADMAGFMRACAEAFVRGAPPRDLLVFKAHPLEDGRERLPGIARALAREFGLEGRLIFLDGGRLAPVLDEAASVVTINSTAGQQALWRGLPLKILGRAVYGKPAFVSAQPLAAFFARPERPDVAAYRAWRSWLLATSQVPGSFYTARGRAQVLRQVVPMLLAPADPYDMASHRSGAEPQLKVVRSDAN
jgi:capsular polysaccharide export protein